MIGTKYLKGGLTKAKFLLLTMCPFKDGSMQENVYVVYMLRIFSLSKALKPDIWPECVL